jgi:hypothetical protein
MTTKHLHHAKPGLAAVLLAGLLTSSLAGAATTLIDAGTNNGSFESVNGTINTSFTTKITQWDGHGSGEIDHWTQWSGVATASDDSGSQVWTPAPAPPSGPEGVRFAFLQPGNAVYNLTSHVAQAGDSFTFSWDHIGTRNLSHTVSLVYLDGVDVFALAGTEVFATASQLTYDDTFTLAADSPAIGKTIGLGVINTSSNWAEVDNFTLTVTPVPEPSAALLGALGVLAVIRRRVAR